jgi:hypothetical protein
MIWAVLFLMVLFLRSPYIRVIDDRLHQVAQVEIILFLVLCRTLSTGAVLEAGTPIDIALSTLLFALLALLIFVLIRNGVVYFRDMVRARQRAAAFKTKYDDFTQSVLKKFNLDLTRRQTVDATAPTRNTRGSIEMNNLGDTSRRSTTWDRVFGSSERERSQSRDNSNVEPMVDEASRTERSQTRDDSDNRRSSLADAIIDSPRSKSVSGPMIELADVSRTAQGSPEQSATQPSPEASVPHIELSNLSSNS